MYSPYGFTEEKITMPSETEKQKRYIFYLRGKYKTKKNTPDKRKWVWSKDWEQVKEVSMKRYKPFFKESDIKISKNTQEVIGKHIKDKKYINNSGTLKVSFEDMTTLHNIINDKLKSCEDKEERLKIKKAIEEIIDKRFTEDITIPLSKGDTFFYGKFKNKQAVYDSHYINDKGDLVIKTNTGKEIGGAKIRLMQENLRISDLQKHSGISNFTKPFMKDRQRIKGVGTKSSKLIKMKVNKKKGWITFVFLSEPTYTFDTKAVQLNTKDKRMKKDNLYTQQIRILDIFSLLKSNPEFKSFKDVAIKDIKEVLKVADIQVSCDDPSFWWQGDAWVLTQFDASIIPCEIEPKHWGKYHNNGDNFLCKHLSLIINSVDFYIPIMAGMIYKYLKK